MVKIIGQDKNKQKTISCKNCGAVLEYYEKDIESKVMYSFEESDAVQWIICPQYNKNVYIIN